MEKKLSLSLFFLRISVSLVMLIWGIDKIINPEHAKKVFSHFYLISDIGERSLTIIAIIQIIITLLFLIGFKKRITYGAIFILHFISTLSSYQQYFNPWKGLLFFAAWPMLAACYTLYILRENDTFLSINCNHCKSGH